MNEHSFIVATLTGYFIGRKKNREAIVREILAS